MKSGSRKDRKAHFFSGLCGFASRALREIFLNTATLWTDSN